MEKKILTYYNEYKQFVEETNLPEITLLNANNLNTRKTLAYTKAEFLRMPIVPIYYTDKLFSYPEQFYKSILFHEFTHIYDAHIFFKEKEFNDFILLMRTFSEYHAAQIELASQLKIEKYSDIVNKFQTKNIMMYRNEKCNIQNYLLFTLSEVTQVLDSNTHAFKLLNDNEFNTLFVNTETQLFYYLGKIDLCKKYGKNKIYDLLLDNHCNEFKQDILKIHSMVSNKNYLLEHINEMHDTMQSFQEHFFEYYK